MLRIENLGTNEAKVYLNKELDREVRVSPWTPLDACAAVGRQPARRTCSALQDDTHC